VSCRETDLIGQLVVVDTDSPIIYLGRLQEIADEFYILEEADVHNLGDTPTTRDKYILDSRQLGIRVNRRRTQIRKCRVVGLSSFEDVL
jgi:hypothetical protein